MTKQKCSSAAAQWCDKLEYIPSNPHPLLVPKESLWPRMKVMWWKSVKICWKMVQVASFFQFYVMEILTIYCNVPCTLGDLQIFTLRKRHKSIKGKVGWCYLLFWSKFKNFKFFLRTMLHFSMILVRNSEYLLHESCFALHGTVTTCHLLTKNKVKRRGSK
jgi:hypothetical protein